MPAPARRPHGRRGWWSDRRLRPPTAAAAVSARHLTGRSRGWGYTSGTTGRPKGALGTHRNICTNLVSLGFAGARAALRRPDNGGTGNGSTDDGGDPAGGTTQNTYLLSVPFFHATGCHSILVANLAAGGKIVIMYRWDPERALELIEREQVSTFGGVPAMVWQVLESPSFETRDISSVKSIGYGGAPAPPELVRRIEAMFPGRRPSNGYGLTETSSVTTMNAGADYLRKPDSVGVPCQCATSRSSTPPSSAFPTTSWARKWASSSSAPPART
jgi:long-chain acyl-CoA synthetase